jgi:hypothetical protein
MYQLGMVPEVMKPEILDTSQLRDGAKLLSIRWLERASVDRFRQIDYRKSALVARRQAHRFESRVGGQADIWVAA